MHDIPPPVALSPAREEWLMRERRRKRAVTLTRLAILVGFFALWELAARLGAVDAFVVSSPSRMARTLVSLARSGELWRHLGVSVGETIVGFTLGTLLGALVAILLWWSPFLSKVLDPYLVVLNALPKTALGPVFIVWMGAGSGSIIAMTLAISLVVTILDVLSGLLSTDPGKLRLMQTLGATRLQLLTGLVLPANLPTLVSALKVNVGLSWVGVIMGEFLVSRAGLGYLIVYGSQVFKMDLVMSTVLLLSLAAAVMYAGLLRLEKLLKERMGVVP